MPEEEEISEMPQNSPISLLEISDEETCDDTTFFFTVDLEEVLRDDAVLEDDEEEELTGFWLTAEEDSCFVGALLAGAEEVC